MLSQFDDFAKGPPKTNRTKRKKSGKRTTTYIFWALARKGNRTVCLVTYNETAKKHVLLLREISLEFSWKKIIFKNLCIQLNKRFDVDKQY